MKIVLVVLCAVLAYGSIKVAELNRDEEWLKALDEVADYMESIEVRQFLVASLIRMQNKDWKSAADSMMNINRAIKGYGEKINGDQNLR